MRQKCSIFIVMKKMMIWISTFESSDLPLCCLYRLSFSGFHFYSILTPTMFLLSHPNDLTFSIAPNSNFRCQNLLYQCFIFSNLVIFSARVLNSIHQFVSVVITLLCFRCLFFSLVDPFPLCNFVVFIFFIRERYKFDSFFFIISHHHHPWI